MRFNIRITLINNLGRNVMRKALVCLALIVFSGAIFCKKGPSEQPRDVVLAKKYAKYRVAVRKEAELKTWIATLEKGEDVDLIQEIEVADKAGKKSTIAKVRLAEGTVGFLEARHLADKVIVFIEETPVFVRPTMGSRVHCKVPKGTIAFVVGEQANWVKVYAGKVGDVWLTEQWVQGGYSADQQIILSARIYEQALDLLASSKESDRKAGKQKLEELSQGEGLIASLSREKLVSLESQPGPDGQPENQEKPAQEEAAQK